jgi:CarD family transcriptional regulator
VEELMQFSVGDKVMHPQYGPGQIIKVEHRELVEGFEHYYVIKLSINNSTLFVPKTKVDELGVRPVMSSEKLAGALATLRAVPRRLSKDFKKRQARIREQLDTARPTQVAEAIRDLTWRRHRDHLTNVDKRLLDRGRELLAAEMAMAADTELIQAHKRMDAALEAAVGSEGDDAKGEFTDGVEGEPARETHVQ